MPHTIACWAYKGGASKTTTCLNTAGALHAMGHSVAVIDQDEQETTVALSTLAGMPFPVLSAATTEAPPDVEYLFLDYPPGYSGASVNGQQDLLIVPVKPVWTDYEATMRGLQSLDATNKAMPIVAMYESTRAPHKAFLEKLQGMYGNDIPVIPKRSAIEDTNNFGVTVFDMPLRTYGVKEAREIYTSIALRVKAALGIPA